MSAPPLLEVRGLEVRFGDFGAVAGADLEVDRGSIGALVGPSGCGKTTLLRVVAGFERPAAGSIRLDGERVAGEGAWVPPERRQVGMVFQEGALFPHLTVEGNVRYGVAGSPGEAERVAEALELVGLEELRGRRPDELSGGQQQRLALARALAPRPRIVLLDEPFASLDAGLRERVREEVRRILERAGTTAILVTHDQQEALSFADRVAVMTAGRVLQVGTPEEVYQRPATLEVAEFFGVGWLLPCRVAGGRLATELGEAWCDAPDGPGVAVVRPEDLEIDSGGEGPGAPAVVEGRRFFGHDVLQSLRLESGERCEVRLLSSRAIPEGRRVRVALLPKRYRVFPASAAATGSKPRE